MKMIIFQGRLNVVCETPAEGFDVAEMNLEARLVNKYVKIHRTPAGEVGFSVPLPDMDYARLIGECPENE